MIGEFHPLVSIIIPIYNGANYMREAIDSALSQTYKNVEIIVVNDGSNDNGETERIALSYGDRIRYIYKPNGGVSSALNLGIKEMKGDYFSWLSHDDKYLPQKIERQINLLGKYNYDINLIALCGCTKINENSERLSNVRKESLKTNTIIPGGGVLEYLFHHGCCYACSLLIPKNAFEKCGYFDERLRFCQDFFMFINFFMNGFSLVFDDHADVQVRLHKKQLTQTGQDIFHKESDLLCDSVLRTLDELSSRHKNYLLAFALYNAKYNNTNSVRRCFKCADRKRLFSRIDKTRIYLVALYGKVRPGIKKLYYMIARYSV